MDIPDDSGKAVEGNRAYIAGMGMVTALGDSVELTTTAVESGISAYQQTDVFNENDQPVTMALVPGDFFSDMAMGIEEGDYYGERDEHVIKMAVVAIREALSQLKTDDPLPVILAFPEPEDHEFSFPANLATNLLKQQDLPLAQDRIRTLHTGRAGGLEAIDLAMRYLYEQQHDYVLVGASDSYFHCPRLSRLSRADRLLAPQNMDGFAPGEGAGFLLLTRHENRAMSRQQRIVAIQQPGLGNEPGNLLDESADYTGAGLDAAVKAALVKQPAPVTVVYSSMNGEHYWAKEHGVMMIRNRQSMMDDVSVEHPADCYGDLGAATGPILAALAATNLLNGLGQGDRALLYCASDGPARAAVCLQSFAVS